MYVLKGTFKLLHVYINKFEDEQFLYVRHELSDKSVTHWMQYLLC